MTIRAILFGNSLSQSLFKLRGGIGTHMLVVSTYLLNIFARSPSQPVRIRSSVIPVVTHMMTELKSVPPTAHHAPTLTANKAIAHQNSCSPKLSGMKKKRYTGNCSFQPLKL